MLHEQNRREHMSQAEICEEQAAIMADPSYGINPKKPMAQLLLLSPFVPPASPETD